MNGYWSVICPHCHAPVGAPCVIPGTMKPLQLSAAHPSRMEAVGKRPDYAVVEKYREMYPASASNAAVFEKPPEGGQPPKEDSPVSQAVSQDPAPQAP